ncbi:hypothetical protein EDB81DRAFT_34260 [Dactylonectria macrodidyma]|uniref:Aminoacyl-tRNA synthetase class Ia domain-containing protein n=1 Tax=Dactylonectria macrodidyma TaxID=307937 RepID=A0A9P9FVG8_9HYPO|nr:hypothetical protein EDB81DRAFT_34260 [Dactylonectria macrodidyma]
MIAHGPRDNAFDAPSLTGATHVLGVKPVALTKCTPLRWKKSKLKTLVFRRFDRDGVLAEMEAMLYSKLRDDMGRQSLDAGFENRWKPRFLRRGTGNAAKGIAPDAVRDRMMRHDPKFATFLSAYLNENVGFDIQNAFLEDETEDQLYRLLAHVSLNHDPRAARDMVPDEFWQNLPPDPAIAELEENAVMTSHPVAHITKMIEHRGVGAWWADPEDDPAWVAAELDGHVYRRWKDTMDVWLDSGTSWTLLAEAGDGGHVADVYLEGSDQHRGWFQSSLLTYVTYQSGAQHGNKRNPIMAPYRTPMTHGFALDHNGLKPTPPFAVRAKESDWTYAPPGGYGPRPWDSLFGEP